MNLKKSHLQFQELKFFGLSVLGLTVINHGLWKQRLNQLVNVVVWLEHLVPLNAITIDDA